MSDTITVAASVTPKVYLSRTDTDPAGQATTITVQEPTGGAAIALSVTKGGKVVLALAGAVVDVNVASLGALAGYQGDASFADLKIIDVRHLGTPGSGQPLKVFGQGTSSAFLGPVPDNASKIQIDPGCSRTLYTRETGGWSVGTADLIRFDPGANSFNVLLTLAGD